MTNFCSLSNPTRNELMNIHGSLFTSRRAILSSAETDFGPLLLFMKLMNGTLSEEAGLTLHHH